MTTQEQDEYLATKVMGRCWHKYDNQMDGKYDKFYGICCLCKHGVSKKEQHMQETWNPRLDWNHWRQVEEKVMEDEQLAESFVYKILRPGIPQSLYRADLPTRVSALISAHQQLNP